MKIDHLDLGSPLVVDLVYSSSGGQPIRQGQAAGVTWSDETGTFLVTQDDHVATVDGRTTTDTDALRHLCRANLPRLAWVPAIQTTAPEGFTLEVHTFPAAITVPYFGIGIDDKIVGSAKELAPTLGMRNATDVCRWLADQCVLKTTVRGTPQSIIFASTGTQPGDDLAGAFVLHGRSTLVHVRRVPHPSGSGEIHRVERITRKREKGKRPVLLVEADVEFTDVTQASLVRADWRAEWSTLSDTESFVKRWQRYGELEIEDTLRRVREVGGVDYHGFEKTDQLTRFDLVPGTSTDRLRRLIAERKLVPSDDLDVWLQRPPHLDLQIDPVESGDLVGFIDHVDPDGAPSTSALERLGTDHPPFSGKVVSLSETAIVLSGIRDDPPSHGTLALSVGGHRSSSKRRVTAQAAIREGTAAMPQLGFLLEGKDIPHPRRGRIEPMSASLRRKLFAGHNPTQSQIDAIDVALNTPDIALIQGPPGTGKTTVIRAILERLNELSTADQPAAGRFLLTGYQHDAVENAAERIDLNGLPPIKFGARSGDDDNALSDTEIRIDVWRTKRADTLRERETGLYASEAQRRVHAILESYLLAPGPPAHGARVLLDAALAAADDLPGDLADRLQRRAAQLGPDAVPDDARAAGRQRLLRAARALRTAPVPYADDGAINAARVLSLDQHGPVALDLDAPSRAALTDLATGQTPASAEVWGQIRALRQHLIQQATPASRALRLQPVLLDDVVELLGEVRDAIITRRRRSLDGATLAISEYLDTLENAPDEIRSAIIEYTAVFAATCQQSARPELAEAKAAEEATFDTVVVDEAARANPLDLFVPLVRAERRIILVGDHRQLPHIIEQRLADQLDAETGDENAEAPSVAVSELIKRSLFEHLFQDALEREHDHRGPQRAVTLDAQFRMHPRLGDFVSTQFYEVHGEPRIHSPLPPEAFKHQVPGLEDAVAVWLDVPAGGRGRGEVRESDGTSWTRPVEAEIVARAAERILTAPDTRLLNVGIITFYRGQVGAIEEALARRGLMDRTPSGGYTIAPPYQHLLDSEGERTGEARLRVGTVDAFQGREFDVVLLSVVRSNSLPDDTEGARQRKYGHLMSPNRLNVAMSRQKRLLVVVGDHKLVESAQAADAIGPLVAFSALAHDPPLGMSGTYDDLF